VALVLMLLTSENIGVIYCQIKCKQTIALLLLDLVCLLWALKYVTFCFFYTFRGTKSYEICDFIYHVMVISEIYDKMWCRNWHLMWFRKDKEEKCRKTRILHILELRENKQHLTPEHALYSLMWPYFNVPLEGHIRQVWL
jgi:hypothetical protein